MVLVDANVILDILTADPRWSDWSAEKLEEHAEEGLAINPVIYAELAVGFYSEEELEAALASAELVRLPLPYGAAFRAGQAFLCYRRQGGLRHSPLPDFYIGAHAEAEGMRLLTRDVSRYRSYFPKIELICPEPGDSELG